MTAMKLSSMAVTTAANLVTISAHFVKKRNVLHAILMVGTRINMIAKQDVEMESLLEMRFVMIQMISHSMDASSVHFNAIRCVYNVKKAYA